MPKHIHAECPTKCGCCNICNLAVCKVCGAYEGSLTTDCPGEQVDFDKQYLVYTTPLNYSDEKGWHQDPTPFIERKCHFES